MQSYFSKISKNSMIMVAVVLFVSLTVWWAMIHPFSAGDNLVHKKYIWGATYQLVAIWGGICGLIIARSWGGVKSFFGKAITYFAVGLLFQALGQTIYSYYNLIANIQAPYPSLGDIGFFGSVIFYIIGIIYLGRVSGRHISFRGAGGKIQAILIPLLMLTLSYSLFLRHYTFDWSNALRVFLDFGYPLGQAVYVSLAILTFVASRNILGGVMRKPIIFILTSLIVQYVCDSYFLYAAGNDLWNVGGIGDFLYLFSYFIMTFSIIRVGTALKDIRQESK